MAIRFERSQEGTHQTVGVSWPLPVVQEDVEKCRDEINRGGAWRFTLAGTPIAVHTLDATLAAAGALLACMSHIVELRSEVDMLKAEVQRLKDREAER